MTNEEAIERLGNIADAFLVHDREILARYDDSVVRFMGTRRQVIRRARGLAPAPVALPTTLLVDHTPSMLGIGPEQKYTFCITAGNQAVLSPHLGDLEDARTLKTVEETYQIYQKLYHIQPEIIAHDAHPGYLSTQRAIDLAVQHDIPLLPVQHHVAHIASVAAEHDMLDSPVLGIALDGTGYGDDGNLWGCEILCVDAPDYQRLATLREMPLPGGAAAIREPLRIAYGYLHELGLLDHPGAQPLIHSMTDEARQVIAQMVDQAINTQRSTSAGRLFDLVSALVGVCQRTTYEGEAAILLEALCAQAPAAIRERELQSSDDAAWHRYLPARDVVQNDTSHGAEPLVTLDTKPLIVAILDDLANGVDPVLIGLRFHKALCTAIVDETVRLSERLGISTVCLSGGVMMNRIVSALLDESLLGRGLTCLHHRDLPPNDGCIAHGQVIMALASQRSDNARSLLA